MSLTADIVILAILTAAALWSVLARSLVRAAICLALASALVALLMFRLGSPLAAVFELSVCSGLISVLFISTITLTESETAEQKSRHGQARLRRFWFLPVLVALLGAGLWMVRARLQVAPPFPEVTHDPRVMLWAQRPLDIVGQVAALLAGVFGVVILFKEGEAK